MTQPEVWNEQLSRLERLTTLVDKPEESHETTLKALWHFAAGDPLSAEAAAQTDLSDLDSTQQEKLIEHVTTRLQGTPLAHITGRQQFMGVELLTSPEALIPRKETEILGFSVQNILQETAFQQKHICLMDICTGAGNLVVALTEKNPEVIGYAADLSADAVSLAKRNVAFHSLENRVEVREGDLLAPYATPQFHHQVDILLCNPPYISSARVEQMNPEISEYEPTLAFDGGAFGVKVLYALMKEAPWFLKPDGWLAFEVGLGQGHSIVKRMEKNYSHVRTANDENGEIRVVMGQV